MTNEREQERRGEEARRIIGHEIYKEAFAAIEARWLSELVQQDIDPKRAEYLRTLLVAGRKHRQYMEQVMVSGTLAAQELERKQTLKERMWRR